MNAAEEVLLSLGPPCEWPPAMRAKAGLGQYARAFRTGGYAAFSPEQLDAMFAPPTPQQLACAEAFVQRVGPQTRHFRCAVCDARILGGGLCESCATILTPTTH